MKLSGAAARAMQMNVADLFRKQARIRSGRPAAVQGERVTSYAELDARTDRLAHALLAEGVVAGDRVAILSENSTAFLDLFIAAAKIGVRPSAASSAAPS